MRNLLFLSLAAWAGTSWLVSLCSVIAVPLLTAIVGPSADFMLIVGRLGSVSVAQTILSSWSIREFVLGGSPHKAFRWAIAVHAVTIFVWGPYVEVKLTRWNPSLWLLSILTFGALSAVFARSYHQAWSRGEEPR